MRVPTFDIKQEKEKDHGTLASHPQWTLAVCEYDTGGEREVIRFRVGEDAYSVDGGKQPPRKQAPAHEYTVKRVIGQIVAS